MTSVGSSSSVALSLIERANQTSPIDAKPGASADIASIASGASKGAGIGVEQQPSQAASAVSDTVFSMLADKESNAKADLLKKLGEAFGLDQSSFSSGFDYGSAIKSEIAKLTNSPNGSAQLADISKQLGLGKLGLSLDGLADAIIAPTSDAGKALDQAIAKEFDDGDQQKQQDLEHASQILSSVQHDENGIYRPSGARSAQDTKGGQKDTKS